MFGSVDEFFYKYLAGIRAPTDSGTIRGYKHIQIKPFVPDDLSSVEASLETINGKVTSSWEKQNRFFRIRITIPANSSGSICLPLLSYENIRIDEGDETIWENQDFLDDVDGIQDAKRRKDCISFSVESGTYYFTVTGQ